MKFGKYLLDKERESWKGKYLDYASLKDLIKLASKEFESQGFADHSVYSPRGRAVSGVESASVAGEPRVDVGDESAVGEAVDERGQSVRGIRCGDGTRWGVDCERGDDAEGAECV